MIQEGLAIGVEGWRFQQVGSMPGSARQGQLVRVQGQDLQSSYSHAPPTSEPSRILFPLPGTLFFLFFI